MNYCVVFLYNWVTYLSYSCILRHSKTVKTKRQKRFFSLHSYLKRAIWFSHYSKTLMFMLSCNKVWKIWFISGVSQAGTAWLRKCLRFLGGRVGRSPLRDSAKNWARMNYFRAKPEYIIGNYIIARETAQPAMKYPLLSVFQLRISL